MSEWTDELKQQVIDEYLAKKPTPDNSVEIVGELADKYEKTPNGVRMILSRAEVYVKKEPPKGGSTNKSSGGTRVSKADAISNLIDSIKATGQEPNEEIISKLTGKAAVYFKEVIDNAQNSD